MDFIDTIGIVGLGKMGDNMRAKLLGNHVNVIGYDVNPDVTDVDSLEALVEKLPAGRRAIWLMLPMFAYESTLDELFELLSDGDYLIDGGNSQWQITRQRHARFADIGVHYVDVGTSGGIYGLEKGYALMVGATDEEFKALGLVFAALKPVTNGLVHAGESGAGHYAKMVHNGAEYGMMAAFAETYALLDANPLIADPTAVFASWQSGSIVESFLLQLVVKALQQPDFAGILPIAHESGEGVWTLQDALERKVPMPVTTAAVHARWSSTGNADGAMRLVAAVRNEFGGHAVERKAS